MNASCGYNDAITLQKLTRTPPLKRLVVDLGQEGRVERLLAGFAVRELLGLASRLGSRLFRRRRDLGLDEVLGHLRCRLLLERRLESQSLRLLSLAQLLAPGCLFGNFLGVGLGGVGRLDGGALEESGRASHSRQLALGLELLGALPGSLLFPQLGLFDGSLWMDGWMASGWVGGWIELG